MRLSVVGLGMVGLPTALLFAESGLEVVGVDIDVARIERLTAGNPDKRIEAEAIDLLRAMLASGRLTFASRPVPADVHIIAVGTPIVDDAPDLTALRAACELIRAVVVPGNLVVIESTVPPGTTAMLAAEIQFPRGVRIGHAPERAAPGSALEEIRSNPRLAGGLTADAGEAIAEIYARICHGRIEITDATTAEFVKLSENAYRDVNIAFANELALMAGDLDLDIWRARDLANGHPRVRIHRPGPGVGGDCVPVAPLFLRAAAPGSYDLLGAARRRNGSMSDVVAKQILALTDSPRPRVTVLGIAYKPDVADDRRSPSHAIVERLISAGAECVLHDPLLLNTTLEEALTGCDVLAVLVAHALYRSLDPAEVGRLVGRRSVVDAVHILDRQDWEQAGFRFVGLAERVPVGRPAAN